MSPESNDLKNNDSLNIFRSTMMFNNGIGQKKYTVGNNIKKQESNYKEKITYKGENDELLSIEEKAKNYIKCKKKEIEIILVFIIK